MLPRFRRYATRSQQSWNVHRFFKQFVFPRSLCFDVGANVGERTAMFLDCRARVVAVEPQPACVAALSARFGRDPRVHIVGAALGAEVGTARMRIATVNVVSSMSEEFVEATTRVGRFGSEHAAAVPGGWTDERIVVPVTTADCLIAEHGLPSFMKIDVEGYELQVLRGLTQPVRALSFEFTPEMLRDSELSVRYLELIGPYEFNYCLADGMRMSLGRWVSGESLIRNLTGYQDSLAWGDIYARVRSR